MNRDPLGRALIVVAGCLILSACRPANLPPLTRDCWIATGQGDSRGYRSIGDDVENLETCGARLEAVFLRQGTPVLGVYQGFFLFVDKDSIRAGKTEHGAQHRLLSQESRERIDAAIRALEQSRSEQPRPSGRGDADAPEA